MTDYQQEYLGDAVYASFDGYHIWLAVNHHDNKVVALEPSVFASLVRYEKRLAEAIERGFAAEAQGEQHDHQT